MSYRVVVHPDVASACRKIRAKDPVRYEQVKKKIRLLLERSQANPCILHSRD